MAIDPRLSLSTTPVDVRGAISSGLQTAESIRNRGVRDQILRQQAQAGQLSLEQAQRQDQVQQLNTLDDALASLQSIPDLSQRAKIFAQQMPILEEMGIPKQRLLTLDKSDQGLMQARQGLSAFTRDFEKTQQPAAVETFQYFQGVISDPNASEEQKKAARIALKLEAPERTFAPKVVDIGGAKYMQVGDQLFNPNTLDRVETDERGLPASAPEGALVEEEQQVQMPTALTPEIQRDMEAQRAAAVTSAKTKAQAEAKVDTPEAIEKRAKDADQAQQTIGTIDNIIASERLDNITGLFGQIPFSTSKTKDLLGKVQQLKSQLTAGNLGLMTGVLSESDIKIIEGLSNDIKLETDESGNVTAIEGSYEGTIDKLKNIRRNVIRGMNANGFYAEGQTATNPDTGQRMIYKDGRWTEQ